MTCTAMMEFLDPVHTTSKVIRDVDHDGGKLNFLFSFFLLFISFGTERRGRSLNQSAEPGPGAYDIPPKFANLPKYALASSLKI